jgi:hypothetical protein
MNNFFRWLAPAVALCISLAALAQPANTDPGKSGAREPRLQYRSAFADYKPWQDTKPGDWKAMNDAVGKSGGHSTGMPAGAASAPASSASKPAMPDHSGHPMHMQGGRK